jgi:predicted MPP superfamily phosphohydrolase
MIRIVHLSDFHLNKKFLKDWNNYVKQALTDKIETFHKKVPVSFIAFTGDLIDIGESDFGDIQTAFKIFEDEIIKPMSSELGLNENEFLIIPGNHDIQRSLDKKRIELGNRSYFQEGSQTISEFIENALENNDYNGMERIKPYKEFEQRLYANVLNAKLSMFGSSFKLNEDGIEVGVCCLNSAWRCYDNEDSGRIIIGEDQLTENLKFIEKCPIKIALVHHPLDWLINVEKDLISDHITKEFNVLLMGHVHESKTSLKNGMTGSLFMNIAPSGLNDIRSDSRKYSNGFTVIDLDHQKNEISCTYLRYNHSSKSFVLNTDLGTEGLDVFPVPSGKSKKAQSIEKRILENLQEDFFKAIDDHLLHTKATKTCTNIKDAFILPPIVQAVSLEQDEEAAELTIPDILKSKSNLIFFGDQESGKTTLLFRLAREFVDVFTFVNKIPVYIDFTEIGNKEIVTLIKEFLKCNTEEANFLIDSNKLVLLVDNLIYSKGFYVDQRTRLNSFNVKHEHLQIIATSESTTSGILPTDFIDLSKIPFKVFFIKNLRDKEIRSIMKQWMPDDTDHKTDLRLEKLVNSFNSYALPSSVMSVSLFLWSLELSDRKPINHAVLLEIYIEILLEKLSKHNIYRENFDFTNKIQLLAKIAEEMLKSEDPNFSISFSDFNKIIEDYLDEVGFHYDSQVIVNYFLERKVFVKHQVNKIKFAYSCFFHFFLAKRMVFHGDFRDFILSEEEYYKYPKEIDYYSGLVRNDENLLKSMLKRLEIMFSHTDFIFDQVDIDRYFSLQSKSKEETEEHQPIAKYLDIKEIKENRPSQEKLEEFYDQILKATPNPQKISRKQGSHSLEGILVLMANVLRNSEGVENKALKTKAYALQVRYSIAWAVLYREYIINYIKTNNALPPSIPTRSHLTFLLRSLPLGVQEGLNKHLGTPKLSQIILGKILSEINSTTVSDVEKFLSVGLYADVEGPDFPKYLKLLTKKVNKNAVRDYLYLKILDYYYRRTRNDSPNEEMYLELLTELKIRSHKIPQQLKMRVMKGIEDAKKAFEDK